MTDAIITAAIIYNITPIKNEAKDSLPMSRQYKQIHFVLGKISLFFVSIYSSISTYLSNLVTHFINIIMPRINEISTIHNLKTFH